MKSILKNSKLLALIVFLFGLLQRVFVSIVFWEKFGWHASHLTEVWFYSKMAAAPRPLGSSKDITLYLLRLVGLIFPQEGLMNAVSILAAVLSSFTGVVIFYLVRNVVIASKREGKYDNFIPLAAAFFYTGISSAQALSIISFTHDLLQMPIILGFLASVIAFLNRSKALGGLKKGLRKSWYYLLIALVLAYFGYNLNPVFFIAIPLLIIYLIFRLLPPKKEKAERKGPFAYLKNIDPQIYFYVILLLVMIFARYVFYDQVLQTFNSFLLKYRNIDLIHLLGQNSKDMVPTAMDKKFIDIYALLFFVPFGFYAAYKHREGIAPTLLIISYFVSVTVDRGSRLLNIALAMIASYAFWYKKKFYILDYVMAGLLILVFFINPGTDILRSYDKVIFVLLPLAILWAYKIYFQKYDKVQNPKIYKTAILTLLLLPSLLSLFLYKYWFNPALTEGEYQMAMWINKNTQAGERIFFNWGEEHYYDFLTHLVPINDLAGTKIDRDKIYWQPQNQAVAYARAHEIKYFLVNSNDFAVFQVPDSDQVGYKFRGAPPADLPTERLVSAFIYDLIYKPGEQKQVIMLHEEIDPATEKWIRIYAIKEAY